MVKSYAGRSWVDDLVGGLVAGNALDTMIDAKAEKRKQAKQVGVIAGDMDNKLFKVEDKGVIGNFMWNKLGLGDAPRMERKDGGAVQEPSPASAANGAGGPPPSAERETVAGGLNGAAAMGGGGGEAPAPLQPGEFTYTPAAPVSFAPPTPTAAAPQMSPVAAAPSAYQQALAQAGLAPGAAAPQMSPVDPARLSAYQRTLLAARGGV